MHYAGEMDEIDTSPKRKASSAYVSDKKVRGDSVGWGGLWPYLLIRLVYTHITRREKEKMA